MSGLLARDLVAGYPGQPPALDGCTLEVSRGRRLALLGANGSGKTTLLRCLSGSLVPQAGRVERDGAVLTHTRAGLTRHRERVQLVVQDPDDQLFSADVARDVSFGPLNLGCSDAETRDRVDETLTLLGLTHLRHRPTHQLSYGERKRVAIAGAVAMRPGLLLLDEPTAGLDPAGTDELFEALQSLEARGTTVVLSTHDVTVALAWADEAAVLAGGRLVQGPPAELLGDEELLVRARLRMPWPLRLGRELRTRGLIGADQHPRDVTEVVEAVQRARPGSAATA